MTRTRGNGSETRHAYDGVSPMVALVQDLASPGWDATLSFTHNPASQIVTRSGAHGGYAWSGHVNVDRAYAVNGLNQYTGAAHLTFGYDANGNLTWDGGTTYAYDVENRLVGTSGGRSASLRYDPLGRLYEVGGPAGITRFLYDGDALIGEYNGAGAMVARYVHGSDAGADDPLMWYGDGFIRWFYADERGSVMAVTDNHGNGVAANSYDEYGIPAAGNQGRFQYTGQAWIPELGLYHYKARIYSPTLGRFLQTDPIGYEDQVNLYAYVANDPVNSVDPTGLAGCGSNTKYDSASCSGGTLLERIDAGARKVGAAAQRASNAISPTNVASHIISAATLGEYSPSQIRGDIDEFLEKPLTNASEVLAAFPGGRAAGTTVKGLNAATRAAGFATNGQLGRVIGWGGGPNALAQATGRVGQINRGAFMQMREQGLTRELAIGWRNQYRAAAQAGRGGDVAKARAAIMEAIVRNW